MSSKPIFMSAPRPSARLTPEDAKRLVEASADLGFARPIREDGATDPALVASASPAKPATRTRTTPAARRTRSANEIQTLRFDVPHELWTALKLESVHRRVTVKYLLIEALYKAGYAVDLESVPEDGRRLR